MPSSWLYLAHWGLWTDRKWGRLGGYKTGSTSRSSAIQFNKINIFQGFKYYHYEIHSSCNDCPGLGRHFSDNYNWKPRPFSYGFGWLWTARRSLVRLNFSPSKLAFSFAYNTGRHCDGPASATATTSASASASASSSEETTPSVTPTAPSPTESVGCEPHGDHWHCDGPAEAGTASSSTASASDTAETGAAGMVGANLIPVFGLAAGAAALFV